MSPITVFDANHLNETGLNLHAVFNIGDLPSEIKAQLEAICNHVTDFRQLILIGNEGQALWQALGKKTNDIAPQLHPVDRFTTHSVRTWFSQYYEANLYHIIYPEQPIPSTEHAIKATPLGLQALGTLAGWHHTSPFMVGINNLWGAWFAYRAVVLADTHFPITPSLKTHSPCNRCDHKICMSACPAKACSPDHFDMEKCINYRKASDSLCRNTCLARVSCPIKERKRYSEDQINYHYTVSMQTIETYTP